MPSIMPISDLRNYTEVLKEVDNATEKVMEERRNNLAEARAKASELNSGEKYKL